MGETNYKITYECDCGCDYGGCGKESAFLLKHNRSCDLYTLVHKEHINTESPTVTLLGTFTDEMVNSIVEILTQPHSTENFTEQDNADFKEVRGF